MRYKTIHYESTKRREWILGEDTVGELYEYNNLGVLKNYVGPFSSNVDDNIEKTLNKAGMIFLPFRSPKSKSTYICQILEAGMSAVSVLFGTALFTFTPGLLLKHERCQSWFLRHSFHVPTFAPSLLLLKMSGLVSVASEIVSKKLLFRGSRSL